MPESLLLAIALLLCVAGLSWLALAMKAHWQQVYGSVPRAAGTVVTLRVLGGLALFAALLVCFVADHATMAPLVWVLALAASALLVAFTLSWRPRWLCWLVPWARPVSGDDKSSNDSADGIDDAGSHTVSTEQSYAPSASPGKQYTNL